MTGAILIDTRPAMIIRSDWRGDPRNTSAPKRAISKRDALIDIISMAQQARPNDMGQMEFLRAQLIAWSSLVNSTPSFAAAAALSMAALSMRAKSSGGPLAKGAFIPSFSHTRCGGPPERSAPPNQTFQGVCATFAKIRVAVRFLRRAPRPRRAALGHRSRVLGHLGTPPHYVRRDQAGDPRCDGCGHRGRGRHRAG